MAIQRYALYVWYEGQLQVQYRINKLQYKQVCLLWSASSRCFETCQTFTRLTIWSNRLTRWFVISSKSSTLEF